MKVLESELRGKTVMSEEGLYLGILRNSLVDEKTGSLLGILIEPSEDIDPRLYHLDDMGHLIFPFESIRSVKDVVIVGS
ncbi:MAG: PRC-barrel domain-containing protein [Thermoplasmatales archaeon]|jgi:sporulation protein YlmC with PRC-barrel domain|nr:MAG: PRC-barrel domain-containing protein [Thermoplasmatales archaeon]